MAGVLFVICVPTENYELSLKKLNDINPNNKHFTASASLENLVEISKERVQETFQTDSNEELISSINKNSEICNSSEITKMSLEKLLKKILEVHKIKNAVWTKGESSKYLQIIFPLESGCLCEGILAVLNEYGIGKRFNSVVSVIPCSLYYKNHEEKMDSGEQEFRNELNIKNDSSSGKNTVWNRFVTSVGARLTVAQVVESVNSNAALTFDFVVMLFIATMLSAIALAENNNVYLVSSMLISPMMGPVMASTFGLVIQDKKLQKIGVVNELVGIAIATAVGYFYGFFTTAFTDKYGESMWPTYEMTSRGEIRTLWVGCLIALLSGAAVALGILGDNVASLVGVAISASLMPPAVNAGLLWGMATMYAYAGEHSTKSIVRTNYYSTNDVLELAALGAMSMCLTFVNIVCIYFAGILVFKIKEVAPLSLKDKSNRFWKYDIKIARDYNRTLVKEEASRLIKEVNSGNGDNNPLDINNKENLKKIASHLHQSTEINRDESEFKFKETQNTWSPSTYAPKRPTIQELKALYFSYVEDEKSKTQKHSQLRFSSPRTLLYPADSSNFQQSTQENASLPSISESSQSTEDIQPSSINKSTCSMSKKFVVTPASIDEN